MGLSDTGRLDTGMMMLRAGCGKRVRLQARPTFPFAKDVVAALMAQIRAGGELVAAKPLPLRLPDPDD